MTQQSNCLRGMVEFGVRLEQLWASALLASHSEPIETIGRPGNSRENIRCIAIVSRCCVILYALKSFDTTKQLQNTFWNDLDIGKDRSTFRASRNLNIHPCGNVLSHRFCGGPTRVKCLVDIRR